MFCLSLVRRMKDAVGEEGRWGGKKGPWDVLYVLKGAESVCSQTVVALLSCAANKV